MAVNAKEFASGQHEGVKIVAEYLDKPRRLRRALWPDKKNPTKGVHPARWTGRGTLFPDVELADSLHGRAIQEDFGLTLVEYYKTEYRKINWQVHSGVAGFWGLNPDTFWIIGGLALKACADLGMLCAKIVLADFEFTRVIDELDEEWQNVRLKRGLAHITALGLDPNEVLLGFDGGQGV